MDRCAVFVDAGYLHESAKTLMLTGHPGATVRANAVDLVREIADLAVAQTELPLLRIYWYAAAPNRNPYPSQRELASLGDIKLRLGNLRERSDGRMVQKGVDAELHADMTGLARNRGAVDFVLLSGDEDMLRAVDEVQSYGVRVHLWGVEAGPDGGNQSLELIAAADRRHVLSEAWVRNVFDILEPPRPVAGLVRTATPPEPTHPEHAHPAKAESQLAQAGAPPPPTAPAAVASSGADGFPAGAPAGTQRPSEGDSPTEASELRSRPAIPKPTDLRPRPAGARPGDTLLYTTSAQQPGFSPTPDYGYYRLSDLTTQAEQFADAAEDARTSFDAITVGKVYARRWRSRATLESAAMLALNYPTIPRTVDAELLRYALARGVDTWLSETDKHQVRHGFWSVLREEVPAGPAPNHP